MAVVWSCNSCPAHGKGLESSDAHMRRYHPELFEYKKGEKQPLDFKH